MTKQEEIKDLKKRIRENESFCNKVYGTTTDGSLGACLHDRVWGLKQKLKELEENND